MADVFVVGDVHGCLDELEALLVKARLGAKDTLVFVGDLVAKGPDSQGVVQLAREREALAVLGNHDAHLLDGRAGKKVLKGTHAEAAASLERKDWTWLEALPLWLELPEHRALVVHGGLLPGVALKRQPRRALLHLRSLTAEGEPSARVDGGAPWAATWRGPQRAIFGHDALRGLQRHAHALGLDTGCVYGRRLTGVWLGEDRVVSVKARRQYQAPLAPADD
jgi:diadenosine tetraphosphatase ApaH/serine/threonine PP2A family protein phosphatase